MSSPQEVWKDGHLVAVILDASPTTERRVQAEQPPPPPAEVKKSDKAAWGILGLAIAAFLVTYVVIKVAQWAALL